MPRRGTRGAMVGALVVGLWTARAHAQPRGDEARGHFVRAVTLYTDGNFEAALVEFQRAYAISENPNLLYNIAAAQESLGHFVEARDALVGYSARGTRAQVAQRAGEIDARLGRLRERIATLQVSMDTPGLRVSLDGVDLSAERARQGVEISAGVRVVRLSAPGFVTREARYDVAGRQRVVIDAALTREVAPLRIAVTPGGAEVLVDGAVAGTTPVSGNLDVPYGEHEVIVRRAGYEPLTQRVTVGAGGAAVEGALRWRDPMPAEVSSPLVVETNVGFPRVTLDGMSVVELEGQRRVPRGGHVLRVEREGYVPVERAVEVGDGEARVRVWMAPTAARLEADRARVRRQRWPAYVLGVGGLVLVGVGLPITLVAAGDRQDSIDAYNTQNAIVNQCMQSSDGPCAQLPDGRQPLNVASDARGQAELDQHNANQRLVLGLSLTGAGLGAIVIGTIVYLRSDRLTESRRPPGWSFHLSPTSVGVGGTF